MLESRLSLDLCAVCRRSGGIGRRKGLKIPRAHKARAGSIPASGTTARLSDISLRLPTPFLPSRKEDELLIALGG